MPWTLESWAEYDIRVFGDHTHDNITTYNAMNTEHALVVLNHRGDLDWMIGWVLIDRMGMLGVSGCVWGCVGVCMGRGEQVGWSGVHRDAE